jgi:hypothetical protein
LQAGASFWRYDLVLDAGQPVDVGGEMPLLLFSVGLASDPWR